MAKLVYDLAFEFDGAAAFDGPHPTYQTTAPTDSTAVVSSLDTTLNVTAHDVSLEVAVNGQQ